MSRVLVTGACGLVGTATVARLRELGRDVVATDVLEAEGVRRADLTDPAQVVALLAEVQPDVVVHLAAVIPPLCYARPALAEAVSVGATGHLVAAMAALPTAPRLVHASSVAVYGARNPHRHQGLLTADLPMAPTELYGVHKAEAERIVRASSLEWVVLRLGGVLTVEQDVRLDVDPIHFNSLLPADGRIQTVDVRDVAEAFAVATMADVVGETLLIGGDETHRLRQSEISTRMSAAAGLRHGIPQGRPGDPDDESTWFATDWMDTTRAQEALGFQRHSWPDMLAEIRRNAGPGFYVARVAAPAVRWHLRRQFAARGTDRPWAAVPVVVEELPLGSVSRPGDSQASPRRVLPVRWSRDGR